MTASAFTSSGGGFMPRVITLPDADIIEDQVAAATGFYDATAVLNSGVWLMQIAAFKAAIPNSGTPALRIFLTATNTAVMAWPASLTNVILEQTFVLGLTPWVKVTNAVHLIGDDSEVVVLPLATKQFFRLTVPN